MSRCTVWPAQASLARAQALMAQHTGGWGWAVWRPDHRIERTNDTESSRLALLRFLERVQERDLVRWHLAGRSPPSRTSCCAWRWNDSRRSSWTAASSRSSSSAARHSPIDTDNPDQPARTGPGSTSDRTCITGPQDGAHALRQKGGRCRQAFHWTRLAAARTQAVTGHESFLGVTGRELWRHEVTR